VSDTARLRIMTHTAFVFPGQGSQAVGMGRELAEAYPAARQIFARADEMLGFPLSSLAWDGPEAGLNDTINTQPALLVHSIAALVVYQERFPGFHPAFVAGHSMGELSALVACGALPFEGALRLARRRGELMKQAGGVSPGGMAAVLGADIRTLERICAEASLPDEVVQVANDNCPGQVVISGAKPALERAIQLAQQAGIRRIRPLAVSIAAHSPLMIHAQTDFNQAVVQAGITDPHTPLVGNVTALPLSTAAEIRHDLQAQLTSRVRWTESVQEMAARGVPTFIELGSGSVLTGLIKRIDEQARTISIGSPADFDKLA
jgi:[acyl-carrier-protein] S-malonyltransferase